MRQLNLDQLRTLVSIVDLGTFSAAAQALHLAQPTVSLHISELESRLGARLVVRGSRRVTPTAAGTALVERARRLLRDADDAVDAVRRQAEGRVGRVRLGTSTGVVVESLPQVLETLERDQTALNARMAAPDYYRQDAGAIKADRALASRIEQALAEKFERWGALDARSREGK